MYGFEEFEEFDFPEENEPIKFVIKADILSPIFGFSVSALTGFNSQDSFTEITRTPIYWEFFLEKRLGIILSVESLIKGGIVLVIFLIVAIFFIRDHLPMMRLRKAEAE